jgi:hypothetical protein
MTINNTRIVAHDDRDLFVVVRRSVSIAATGIYPMKLPAGDPKVRPARAVLVGALGSEKMWAVAEAPPQDPPVAAWALAAVRALQADAAGPAEESPLDVARMWRATREDRRCVQRQRCTNGVTIARQELHEAHALEGCAPEVPDTFYVYAFRGDGVLGGITALALHTDATELVDLVRREGDRQAPAMEATSAGWAGVDTRAREEELAAAAAEDADAVAAEEDRRRAAAAARGFAEAKSDKRQRADALEDELYGREDFDAAAKAFRRAKRAGKTGADDRKGMGATVLTACVDDSITPKELRRLRKATKKERKKMEARDAHEETHVSAGVEEWFVRMGAGTPASAKKTSQSAYERYLAEHAKDADRGNPFA